MTGPVDVGVWISVNSDKAYSALGFDNLGLGDNKAQAQAVVDYLNQHGGMNGRRINPIYATYDASNTDSATQEQAACATWTTDHHVVAVVSPFNFSSNLAQCLTKRSVPLLYENIYGYGASDFSKYALVGPGTVNLDRFADVYVSQLQRAGFFTASTTDAAKIGVLYMDTPSYRSAWEHSLKPAFARRNLTVTESQGIPLTASEQSDLQSALLRFRSAGVTRIVTMDIGSVLWTLGSTFAESQAYRPKWGLSSSSVPGTVQSATPTNQNVNVTGVGFVPLTDVDINHQPAPTRAVAQCASIMRAAGQASTSSATQVTERAYCDTLFLLERATRSATALSPGRAGLAAIFSGVNALGSSFAPSNTFSTSLSAGKHDGASAVRTFNYSQGCSCYTYTAAAVSVP